MRRLRSAKVVPMRLTRSASMMKSLLFFKKGYFLMDCCPQYDGRTSTQPCQILADGPFYGF